MSNDSMEKELITNEIILVEKKIKSIEKHALHEKEILDDIKKGNLNPKEVINNDFGVTYDSYLVLLSRLKYLKSLVNTEKSNF